VSGMEESPLARIAALEARVAALEAALRRRSRELRAIQRSVCRRDLLRIARILDGPGEPNTDGGRATDVETALQELWRSVVPPESDVDAQ
jgi:hypothetical protein